MRCGHGAARRPGQLSGSTRVSFHPRPADCNLRANHAGDQACRQSTAGGACRAGPRSPAGAGNRGRRHRYPGLAGSLRADPGLAAAGSLQRQCSHRRTSVSPDHPRLDRPRADRPGAKHDRRPGSAGTDAVASAARRARDRRRGATATPGAGNSCRIAGAGAPDPDCRYSRIRACRLPARHDRDVERTRCCREPCADLPPARPAPLSLTPL